jgi:hypothetical protein
MFSCGPEVLMQGSNIEQEEDNMKMTVFWDAEQSTFAETGRRYCPHHHCIIDDVYSSTYESSVNFCNATSQKTIIFILTAVRSKNLTEDRIYEVQSKFRLAING